MNVTETLYGTSLSLLTDLYELTMAAAHWKLGVRREAAFHLTYRRNPFEGGYVVAAGLQTAVELLERFEFTREDRDYLATLTGADGKALFEPAFLDHLGEMRFACDVDAVPEGTVVFPHEPLVRVTGPIEQAQIVETMLLTVINFQSLVATKAARVAMAARGEPVLEFGLRRAQGIDGGLSASRAAYLGGAAATSNVLAGKLWGIPVKGTHAHSWVMCFDDELESFDAYAKAMPNNSLFLVDTYDSLQGVRHAVEIGRKLRAQGHEMVGIRLDSGDLAWLSIEARQILDESGFPNAAIVGSNDLDERLIESLKLQGARINVWGVGTRLATAFEDPALGGVYKLAAVREQGGDWVPRIKLSEQSVKTSIPGLQRVRRYFKDGEAIADCIYTEGRPPQPGATMLDPFDPTRSKALPEDATHTELLEPVFRKGRRVWEPPSLEASRQRVRDQLATMHDGIKRFLNPHVYPVGLEPALHDERTRMILEARGRR